MTVSAVWALPVCAAAAGVGGGGTCRRFGGRRPAAMACRGGPWLAAMVSLALAAGCDPQGVSPQDSSPQPAPTAAVAPTAANLANTSTATPATADEATFRPLYLDAQELARWRAMASDNTPANATTARQFGLTLALSEALSRPMRYGGAGVYVPYMAETFTAAYRPQAMAAGFRHLLGDGQTARDLALAWALEMSGQGELVAVDGPLAAAAGRERIARRAVQIIVGTLLGPLDSARLGLAAAGQATATPSVSPRRGGLRPEALDRQSSLELGLTVCNLYFAADLLWTHDAAWRDPHSGADLRPDLCRWAWQMAGSVRQRLPTLRGRSATWGHHLWVASLAVAARHEPYAQTARDQLTHALTGTDIFSLTTILDREISPLGESTREQWLPDGPGRAMLTLGATLLTARLAAHQLPQTPLPEKALAAIERGLAYQYKILSALADQTPTPVPLATLMMPLPQDTFVAGRHPAWAWSGLAHSVAPKAWPTGGPAPHATGIVHKLPPPPEAAALLGHLPGPDSPADTPRPLVPVFGPLMLLWSVPSTGS